MKIILYLSIFVICVSCSKKTKVLEKKLLSCKTQLVAYENLANSYHKNEAILNKKIKEKNQNLIECDKTKRDMSSKEDYLRICKKSLIDEKVKVSFCKEKIRYLKKYVDIVK